MSETIKEKTKKNRDNENHSQRIKKYKKKRSSDSHFILANFYLRESLI